MCRERDISKNLSSIRTSILQACLYFTVSPSSSFKHAMWFRLLLPFQFHTFMPLERLAVLKIPLHRHTTFDSRLSLMVSAFNDFCIMLFIICALIYCTYANEGERERKKEGKDDKRRCYMFICLGSFMHQISQ